MNLQIVSNTVAVVNKNQCNKFEMKLARPINALQNNVFLEVLNVCYPATTKNVLANTCFMDIEINVENFKRTLGAKMAVQALVNRGTTVDDIAGPGTRQYTTCEVNIKTKRVNIPAGIYNLQRLIEYVNNAYVAYNMYFSVSKSGKVVISSNLNIEYWLLQASATYAGTHGHDGIILNSYHESSKAFTNYTVRKNNVTKQFPVRVTIKLSEKLAFMFGFNNPIIELDLKDNDDFFVTGNYLPDVSDGLNKIFIYCEELERSLVGDSSSELLTTVPLQWDAQGGGNGQLISFSPVKTKKKFKKADILSLHISLRDTTGELIPFDSGTVTIDCLVHNA